MLRPLLNVTYRIVADLVGDETADEMFSADPPEDLIGERQPKLTAAEREARRVLFMFPGSA